MKIVSIGPTNGQPEMELEKSELGLKWIRGGELDHSEWISLLEA